MTLTGLFPNCPVSSRTESNRIHICKNLAPYRRHIINKASTKRKNELNGVWTIGGKIFIKTTSAASPINISCEEDLENLKI